MGLGLGGSLLVHHILHFDRILEYHMMDDIRVVSYWIAPPIILYKYSSTHALAVQELCV